MFNQETVVAPRDVKGELYAHSIFSTIQGEGPFSGHPAIFIRLYGCNFTKICKFCDAFFDEKNIVGIDNILKRVEDITIRQKLVVITGGEPFLYDRLNELCERLIDLGYIVQIETNGSIYREINENVFIVCSPKAPVSGYAGEHAKINERFYSRKGFCLKFVVCAPYEGMDRYNIPYTDIPNYAKDYLSAGGIVYVSPMNLYTREPSSKEEDGRTRKTSISYWDDKGIFDKDKNAANHYYAADIAMKYGCYVTLQSHLFLQVP